MGGESGVASHGFGSPRVPATASSCQMTKLKQFSKKYDVLYSRESNPWMVEHSASKAVLHSSQGILGRSKFGRAVEAEHGNRTRRAGDIAGRAYLSTG